MTQYTLWLSTMIFSFFALTTTAVAQDEEAVEEESTFVESTQEVIQEVIEQWNDTEGDSAAEQIMDDLPESE